MWKKKKFSFCWNLRFDIRSIRSSDDSICDWKWGGWAWLKNGGGKPGRPDIFRQSWVAARWAGIPKWWKPAINLKKKKEFEIVVRIVCI